MAEESFEEECSNKVLPWPFHPKLDKVSAKHATCCVAAAVHMLLCKHFFNTKMNQAKCTYLFTVHHMAVLGQKYDPIKKVSKQKSMKPSLMTQKKQDRPSKEKTETTEPTKKYETTTTIPDDKSSKLDTDDSLPDPCMPKEDQTKVSTKEGPSVEDIQDTKDIDTMPELILSDDDETPQKTFTSKTPPISPKPPITNQRHFSESPYPSVNNITSRHHPKYFEEK